MTVFRRDTLEADPTCPMCAERVVDRTLFLYAGWFVAFGSVALWLVEHRIVNDVLFLAYEWWATGCS